MPDDTGTDNTGELWLYGVVGGWWFGFDAESVAYQLRQLGDVDNITVRLHSPGGSALEGIAIGNLLRNHQADVTVVVDGLAASAASVIAVAGDEVVMSPGAQMLLHDPWLLAIGNATDLRHDADFLDGQGQNLAGLYADRAGGTADDWRQVMQAVPDGTWYTGDEAVDAGLADRVGTITARTPAPEPPTAVDDDDDLAARAAWDLQLVPPAARTAAMAAWRYPNAAVQAVTTQQENTMPNPAPAAPAATAPAAADPAPAPAPEPVADADTSTPPAPATASTPPAAPANPVNPQLPATRRPAATAPGRALRTFASQIADAMHGAYDAGQVNAALADITPGNAGTDGTFMRPEWLGQLWEPLAPTRRIVSAIGVKPMTSMKMQGWKWETKPEVAPYAGNKAEIPTNPAQIVPAEADGHRIAAGWDLDRIYVDFNTGFVEAFLQAATVDYTKKSEVYLIDGHGAVVGPPAVEAAPGIISDATDLGAQDSLTAALEAIVTFLTSNGANVNFLAMASDVYSAFLNLDEASVPWWLKNQATVTLDGSVSIADLTIGVDPGMALGMVLGGDRQAVSLWETGPIKVQAINLPNGGIDLALFGYHANMVHDGAGLAKCSVAGGTTGTRTAAKKSS